MSKIKFSMSEEQVTVFLPTGPRSFYAGSTQYAGLQAILGKPETTLEEIQAMVEPLGLLTKQLYGTDFLVSADGAVTYKGFAVPQSIVDRMNELAMAGESITPIRRFYERLDMNPSKNAHDNVYDFVKHNDIQIEADGTLLAYKGVRKDGYDRHSGTIDNTPGKGPDGRTIIRMPRNQISEDRRATCEAGLHVGAKGYAAGGAFATGGFAPRHMIVRVCPSNVVCVPEDYNGMKMRVCEYEVVGEYAGQDLTPDQVEDTEGEGWTADLYAKTDSGQFTKVASYTQQDIEDAFDPDLRDEDDEPVFEVAETEHPLDDYRRAVQLMEFDIQSLRDYAGKSLKIVGATKIPGGKAALIAQIMKARRRLGR